MTLHPAAEAGEKNDERPEKERHQDGKSSRFTLEPVPLHPRLQDLAGSQLIMLLLEVFERQPLG